MNKQNYLVIIILIIAVIVSLGFMISQILKPATKKLELCNDGWSYQNEDGKIYETYVPELDTCKK